MFFSLSCLLFEKMAMTDDDDAPIKREGSVSAELFFCFWWFCEGSLMLFWFYSGLCSSPFFISGACTVLLVVIQCRMVLLEEWARDPFFVFFGRCGNVKMAWRFLMRKCVF